MYLSRTMSDCNVCSQRPKTIKHGAELGLFYSLPVDVHHHHRMHKIVCCPNSSAIALDAPWGSATAAPPSPFSTISSESYRSSSSSSSSSSITTTAIECWLPQQQNCQITPSPNLQLAPCRNTSAQKLDRMILIQTSGRNSHEIRTVEAMP